jgi:two-component system response regulator PilR (NtrC family)
VHELSLRADKPFVAVNCGAIPETLIESELFGHVRGSFTGANTDKQGLFEAAHGGTLLLDEVAELPVAMQVKLLRVLQERKVKPVGGVSEREVDVRIVAATNRDLETEVEKGTFRQDLFYRLNVIQLRLPPLRDRREDIPLLVDHFIRKFSAEHGRQITGTDPDAMSALMGYHFPGNVRELENLLERAYAMGARESITFADLPSLTKTPMATAPAAVSAQAIPTLGDVERDLILKALSLLNDDKEAAAKALGISRRTIYRRLKEYGML